MDEQLESAIDAAGRNRVFALMKEMGWGPGGAPKWAWYEAAQIVIKSPPKEKPHETE